MADISELGRFMAAIRKQESSGNYNATGPSTKYGNATGAYQFIDSTWGGYEGYQSAKDAPPEVQDARAAQLMTEYFEEFGRWDLVAVAWHAGPGRARTAAKSGLGSLGSLSDGYMTTRNYAAKAVESMASDSLDVSGLEDFGAENLSATDIEQRAREQYPELAYMLDDPEIRDIILEAADPDRGLDDATLESRIRQTTWWQTHSESMREFDSRESLDPSSVAREVAVEKDKLRRAAIEFGAQLSDAQLDTLARQSLRIGLTDAEITSTFVANLAPSLSGNAYAAGTDIRNLAANYLVDTNEAEVRNWIGRVANGQTTVEDIEKYLAKRATAKFAGNAQVAELISQGITPGEFFSDHKRLIASELDIDADQVNLGESQWMNVLSHSGDGVVRPATLSETRKMVRKRPEWQETSTGRQVISERTLGILGQMGVVR